MRSDSLWFRSVAALQAALTTSFLAMPSPSWAAAAESAATRRAKVAATLKVDVKMLESKKR